jgi:tetratricopeptide (TPR) repeat protein
LLERTEHPRWCRADRFARYQLEGGSWRDAELGHVHHRRERFQQDRHHRHQRLADHQRDYRRHPGRQGLHDPRPGVAYTGVLENLQHIRDLGITNYRGIDCHMPPATFMQIDERRDHSIRIPRPDRSVEFGTPNACNGCHAKASATWARDRIAAWFPTSRARTHFVDALGKDRKGGLDAPHALRELVENAAVPAIARATALERLGHYPAQKTPQTLRTALASPEPLVVYGAVLGAALLPPDQRAPLLLPALEHPARAVRIAAAKALAGVPVAQLPSSARPGLDRAFIEVEQSFDVSASRAETHVEQSAFELARGNLSGAEASLQTALRLEPCLAEAHLNLADLSRQRGDEAAAERAIRAALACSPRSAAAYHALGLWQARASIERRDRQLAESRRARTRRYALQLCARGGAGRKRQARRGNPCSRDDPDAPSERRQRSASSLRLPARIRPAPERGRSATEARHTVTRVSRGRVRIPP